jgi:ABC-2 type transport system permease protein
VISALYKLGMKSLWKMVLIFAAVLCMYIVVVIWMFDPELGAAILEFEKAMPGLMAMFGMETTGTTLLSFISSYLYGMIMLVMPMIFTIIAANRLIARFVDRGAMAWLLAAPHKRSSVAFTQAAVLLICIVTLIVFAACLGAACSAAMFPGELDIGPFLRLNLGCLFLQIFIGGWCFLCSCIFNETRKSLLWAAGLPVLEYIVQMLANMGGKLEGLKYATFFSLFDPRALAEKASGAVWPPVILLAAGLIMFAASICVFNKKDMCV